MVLSGEINKNLASLLNHHGAKAIGISGKDSGIIKAIPKDGGKVWLHWRYNFCKWRDNK